MDGLFVAVAKKHILTLHPAKFDTKNLCLQTDSH